MYVSGKNKKIDIIIDLCKLQVTGIDINSPVHVHDQLWETISFLIYEILHAKLTERILNFQNSTQTSNFFLSHHIQSIWEKKLL